MNDRTSPPRVVIVGAGFGGLAAAKGLAKEPVQITIVDRQNHHLFQPLLYQVATAALNPSDIAQPVRHILSRQANCTSVLANVTGIETDRRVLTTSVGELEYDYLVVATGATHAYFGNEGWATHAPGLKTIEDALDIRRRVLLGFERAEQADTIEERERQMTFVVVGAGPTGVEMAGAIREIATQTLRDDFRHIDTSEVHVHLVEAGPAVLPPFTPKLQRSATKQLRQLGVNIQTDTRVTDITDDGVTTTKGYISAATTIWAAGVAASELGAAVTDEVDRSGRAVVTSDLSLKSDPNVFAVGDVAAVTDAKGVDVPGVGAAATQGGAHVAKCIKADLAGKTRPSFVYNDKGSMATIGRSKAVAHLGRLQFGGRLAWILWCVVHVWLLVDFRSKVRTMSNWTWQYFTGQRGARLITGHTMESLEPMEPASSNAELTG